MYIRPYRPADKERLRYICKETAWDSYKADENKLESVPILYNDYFTEQEPEYVFVLADETDTVVGYIICSVDYEKFHRLMDTEYRSRVLKVAPEETKLLDSFLEALEKIKDRAEHIHMDMLPQCQHQGWGKKMLDALIEKLKADGIQSLSGCMVSRGAASYRLCTKYGFREIYDYGNDVVAISIELADWK